MQPNGRRHDQQHTRARRLRTGGLRPGGRRGSVGRRRQGSPDTDRPGRHPHTAIAKANWGRAFVLAQLAPVSNDAGALIGFDTDGWTDKPQEQTYDSTT